MKILVTGGAGYIGSHTILALIEKGYTDIVSADSFINSDLIEYAKIEKISGIKIVNMPTDLSKVDECKSLFAKHRFDAVIHFAALKSVPESVEMPTLYYRNNLNALLNVMDCMKEQDCNHLIFSSSCSVYGNPPSLPVSENTPFGIPESPYAHTKQIGEEMILAFSKANPAFKAISLRYFNPAGAHESGLIGEVKTKRPNNLVPIIAQQAIGIRDSFQVFGSDYNTPDGTCIRDYVHVSDIADAHVLALAYLTKLNSGMEVFNLGSGKGASTLEVVHCFERENNIKLNYSIVERRAGDIERIYADYQKANKILNWKPKRGLKEIVRSAWKWQQNA